jgi:hypothetical protein
VKRIALLALLTACGGENPTDIAPEAQGYYEEFLEHSRAFGRDVSQPPVAIRMSPTTTKVGPWEVKGSCQDGVVTLNSTYWQYMNDNQKRLLVYHELGHCLLGLDHSSDPQSIMVNSTDLAYPTFVRDPETAIADLFR